MKRIIATLAVIFTAASSILAQNKPGDSALVLTKEWKAYEKYDNDDKPQDKIVSLKHIISESEKHHYSADFYEAVSALYQTEVSRNWKVRDSVATAVAKMVASFDEPVVTLCWMQNYWSRRSREDRLAYISRSKDRLTSSSHPYFYQKISYPSFVQKSVRDDYEWALWMNENEPFDNLASHLGDSYPNGAYLEYLKIDYLSDEKARRDALVGFASRHKDDALGLEAEYSILHLDLLSAERDNAGEAAFLGIRNRADDILRRCSGFSGIDKEIAAIVKDEVKRNISDKLEQKTVDVTVEDGVMTVACRNVKTVSYSCSPENSKNVIWKGVLTNAKNSFYVKDTLKVNLPSVDDGNYVLTIKKGGDNEPDYCNFEKTTLSMAVRWQKEGVEVFVADYRTGEPVKDYKVSIIKNEKEIASASLCSKDGLFALLPGTMQELFSSLKSGEYLKIKCSVVRDGVNCCTGEYSLSSYDCPDMSVPSTVTRAEILKDRSAYCPGDVLKFKSVLYSDNPEWQRARVEQGRVVEVFFDDSEGNRISKLNLTTNEFGSVAGEFQIPTGLRGGRFHLYVRLSGSQKIICDDWIRVDEFVLPSFEIVFEEDKTYYEPGDEVVVSGRVVSYSGHSLSGASVKVRVDGEESTIVPDMAGRFSVKARFPESRYYSSLEFLVTVTDQTGETISSSVTRTAGVSSLSISVDNEATGECENGGLSYYRYISTPVVFGNTVRIRVSSWNNASNIPYRYSVENEDGTIVSSGAGNSSSILSLDVPRAGRYTIIVESRNIGNPAKASQPVLCVDPSSTSFSSLKSVYFYAAKETKVAAGDCIEAYVGSSEGPVWLVATLTEREGRVVETRLVLLAEGIGSQQKLVFDYPEDLPSNVHLNLFYFKNGKCRSYTIEYIRTAPVFSLPLSFNIFRDKAAPGESVEVSLITNPGVEAVATVYDKSLETIARNYWPRIYKSSCHTSRLPEYIVCGNYSGCSGYDGIILGTRKTKSANVLYSMAPVSMRTETAEESIAFDAVDMEESAASLVVRERFENSLAFLPYLRSDSTGKIDFSFRTSDKLSTYVVKLFAHDKNMGNSIVEGEMIVTTPVKVAVVTPRYLYSSDAYTMLVSVASSVEASQRGRVYVYTYADADYKTSKPLKTQYVDVSLSPMGSCASEFAIDLPADYVGIKVVYVSADGLFSDGVFVDVPIKEPVQTLTEAHSAVLLSGKDKAALVEALRCRFVNVDAADITPKEISLLDMIKEMVGKSTEVKGNDVISLSENYYGTLVGAKLEGKETASDKALLDKVLACRNEDGGFAWFEGMKSSPVITSVILERFARMKNYGFDIPDLTSSVRYLDASFAASEQPWYSRISMAQYMYVRSLYVEVPFTESNKTFKKAAKAYLIPKKSVGLQGQILAKVRRVNTVENLLASDEGKELAKAWGLGALAQRRMARTIARDVASLQQYAVRHIDGGYYYPNAVMPWRGLLESEAYAHAQLCRLMDRHNPEIAEGIRLWLMLQKETQDWKSGADFVDVVAAVLDGTKETLDTKVVVLSKEYTRPFSEIKASGNDMTLTRRFFKDAEGKVEISEGDILNVGDKVYARYEIWSKENRSYVRLMAPREAMFRPIDQLSGYRWGRGYRSVKADRTEYYFESFPEEKTTIVEEFYVTQKGEFTAPVCEIETIYAPHYRANAEHISNLRSN